MTYQVLARKWRPRLFKDLIGQEHVLQALVHALDRQRLHHAYLFTGTRGVGKTTIGRILARCLNCEEGISAEPCGTCDTCREILEGRFVDLIEIDAASRTKVEDMRELLDNVQYSPTRGRFKIYLIDEVHMLSNSSFNALLKTLEEPPDHVKFLFATTDPQKLPVTILSRCLQFNLKRMTPENIVKHLGHVLEQEQIEYESEALWLLARAADGSMRDALSLTDQAIAYGSETLKSEAVSGMLGTIDHQRVYELIDALVARDGNALLGQVEAMAAFSPDYRQVLADLLAVFHRCALEQMAPGSTDNALGDAERLTALAAQLSAEDVQLFYQTALMARQDLEVTPDARMGFEMALLRMLAFRPGVAPDSVSVEASAPAAGTTAPQGPAEPARDLQDTPEKKTESAAPEPAKAETPVTPSADVAPEPPGESSPGQPAPAEPAQVEEPSGPPLSEEVPIEAYDNVATQSEPAPEPEPAAEKVAPQQSAVPVTESPVDTPPEAPAATQPVATPEGPFDWCRDFNQLPMQGMAKNLASESALEVEGSSATLIMDEGHMRLLNDRHKERILEALQAVMPQIERLACREGEPGEQAPAAYQRKERAERQASAVEAIRGDPHVKALVDSFDGAIVEDTIEPL
ncbi:DNA polymerase III subunit gamma/tau [Marinobacteraceae bacterium S3BR75-40.1]